MGCLFNKIYITKNINSQMKENLKIVSFIITIIGFLTFLTIFIKTILLNLSLGGSFDLSLIIIAFLFSLTGFIISIFSIKKINKNNLKGKGFMIASIIISGLIILSFILLIVWLVFFPHMIQ